jgi:hypothetical protein
VNTVMNFGVLYTSERRLLSRGKALDTYSGETLFESPNGHRGFSKSLKSNSVIVHDKVMKA